MGVAVPLNERNKIKAIGKAKVADFGKISKPKLEAWCFSRDRPLISSKGAPYPGKGSVAEASEGVTNLIRLAWEKRASKVILKTPAATQRQEAPVGGSLPQVMIAEAIAPLGDSPAAIASQLAAERPPSQLLMAGDWVDLIDRVMIGNTITDLTERPAAQGDAGEKADFLVSKLIPARLHFHFEERAPGKLSHKAIRWFVRQIPALAAMAIRADHIRMGISFASHDTELLTRKDRFMPFSSIAGQKVAGAYGVETEEGEIPRSGSSIEMIGRKEGKGGHDEGAVKGGSDFYDFYPSKASALGKNENYPKRGYYEDLTFIVLQGYDPDNSEAVSALTKKGGIFNWADEDLQYIREINFSGIAPTDLKKKQLRMVNYALELFYDLLIPGRLNVSKNPGFETPLGVFGGE